MNTHADSARSSVRNKIVLSVCITVVVVLLSLIGVRELTVAASVLAVTTVFCMFFSQHCSLRGDTGHRTSIALKGFLYHNTEPDHIDPCKS